MRNQLLTRILPLFFVCVSSLAQNTIPQKFNWPDRIALSFIAMHPDSIVYADEAKSRKWNYEQGLLLEAMFQMWKHTNDSQYVNYIQKNLDYYIEESGAIRTYSIEEYNIDNIAPGKPVLRMFEHTGKLKYRNAADTLRRQLRSHPRTPSGGFWHKKIYPNQMWLDGLYMAEPFYTLYSLMNNDTASLDDVAHQFLLISQKTYDSKTGLYFHGWDESKKERWANPQTGCSPNFWGRSIGWFSMALVDVLEYFPVAHPKRNELLRIFQNLAARLLKVRDVKSNLWYQVIDKGSEKGNYLEASASAMFIYALAKGANRGYLPKEFKLKAQESFQGLMKNLVTVDSVGVIHLNNVCKVSGLGGKPYRDGSFEYYISEPKRTDDFKGYGPFLLAAIELEKKEKRKIVGLDYYYNNEYTIVKDTVKKRAHYVWEDTTNGGFSGLATIIDRLGADLDTLQSPPTLESLNRFSVYIIVDPDTPKETQELHYIQPEQSAIIEQWVKEGGTLVLMGNDSGNAEFKHLNELAGRFGIHFNEDSHHPVKGKNYETGRCTNLPNHPIFDRVKSIFIKELSSLKLTPPAKEILVEKGITIIAESRIGKGLVLAIGDPWFYNEYLDNRRLPVGFENYDAAVSVFRWLLTNAKNIR